MLNHIIGLEEAAKLWDLSTNNIQKLCEEGKVVAKKIEKTWVIYKDQAHPSQLTIEDVKELAADIEWQLMSPQERMAILDENSRVFYGKAGLMKNFLEKGMEESFIREMFEDVSDEEYNDLKKAAAEMDEKGVDCVDD